MSKLKNHLSKKEYEPGELIGIINGGGVVTKFFKVKENNHYSILISQQVYSKYLGYYFEPQKIKVKEEDLNPFVDGLLMVIDRITKDLDNELN